MHAPGLMQLLLILVVVLVVFGGKGKLSSIMSDFAQGIKGFKKGLQDEPTPSENARVEDGTTIEAKVINKEKSES
jgi:sec-independent protein translocase protein TatA